MIFDETLEAMDLFTNIEDKLIDNWDVMYGRLEQYIEEYGNTKILYNQDKLPGWIQNQRMRYRMNKLSEDKINKLNRLNFVWEPSDIWNEMYDYLIEYKKNLIIV